MKVFNAFKFLTMLKNRMGNDLIYNLYLDVDSKIYLTVSTIKSETREFKDKVNIHRVHINDRDMQKHDFILCNEINNIFSDLIVEKS